MPLLKARIICYERIAKWARVQPFHHLARLSGGGQKPFVAFLKSDDRYLHVTLRPMNPVNGGYRKFLQMLCRNLTGRAPPSATVRGAMPREV